MDLLQQTTEIDRALRTSVDSAWYLERYPDVAAAGVDPIDHYAAEGHLEGRFPNAAAEIDHALRTSVDSAWYLERYPDVAAAGVDPIDHYAQVGYLEGRHPNIKAALRTMRQEVGLIDYESARGSVLELQESTDFPLFSSAISGVGRFVSRDVIVDLERDNFISMVKWDLSLQSRN